MDLLDLDNLKPEKPNTTLRIFHFNRLRTFANIIRTILELCAALALLSWSVHRLPSAVKISGEFLHRMAGIISSHLFVFLLGNSIVAALLFAKARNATSDEDSENDFYEETLSVRQPLPDQQGDNPLPSHVTEEEIFFEDKEVILSQVTCQDSEINKTDETTSCCFSDSEEGKESAKAEEELSEEEFRRAVEEFIAKHLRFRREESLAIVLQNFSVNSLAEIASA